MLSTSVFLTLAAQCAANVHPSTLLDVARVESGLHPYAIAEIIPPRQRQPGQPSVVSHYPSDASKARQLTERITATGHRYSVGLMQITSTNFQRYGVTAEDLFSPCTNLSVAARILTECYQRGETLARALSCYYSGDFQRGQQPEAEFSHTSYLQRIGYTVPASRSTDPDTSTITPSPELTHPRVIWPGYIVRGLPASLRQTTAIPPAPRTTDSLHSDTTEE